MLIKANTLVLYKNKPALVSEITGDKYLIRIAGGDSKSVRLKDIEFLYPGPCSTLPTASALPDNAVLAETVELMAGETMPFADFTELLFGSYTAANALAAYEIAAQNCFFSGTISEGITANSREHIKSILEKEQLKAAANEARAALLERIRTGSVTAEDRPALREIENVASGTTTSSKLMHDLGMEAAPDKAQSLLLKLGVWNDFDNNPWPKRFEVASDNHLANLPEALPEEKRLDLTALPAYAIDDTDSNDPDDAISYDAEKDILWVHVADPASVIKFDSEWEKSASQTGSTLYLPEQIVPMLPENAVPMFGLGLQEVSPALSFGIKIAADGNVELLELAPSLIKAQCLDYAQGDELMQQKEFAPCVEALDRFRNMRKNNQAVLLKLPEVKIKTDIPARSIKITPLVQNPVRELVANAMMAAGHAAAKFAVEHDFALPFAVQEDPEMSERPETLPGMYALRKSCRPSNLSTLPGKHAGLGLDPYARVTSPLRRYEDLLSHIQLRKYLSKEPLLSASEIDDRIADSEPAAVMRGKLERQCREYWTLVMLKNSPEPWQGTAIFAAKPDDRSVWLLPDLAYEFKNRYNARIPLGETVTVECIASDPAALSVQFKVLKSTTLDAAEELI